MSPQEALSKGWIKREKQSKGGFSLKKPIIPSHQESKDGLMQCSCGGPTEDRKVVRKKRVVSEYARCESCGRVHVWWSTDVRTNNAGDRKAT